jgi:hypothetical protein
MKFEIAEEIQNCAKSHCTKALNCLVDDEHRLCPVERCVKGEVHFIKCLDDNGTCPIRKEIYNKYHI